VVETSISAYQEIVHVVQVTDTSRPFKATIVWMDPVNSIISEKLLLNNLDLKVQLPDNSLKYGNNLAGDETNNVRSIMNRPLRVLCLIVNLLG
jgi:hypothetical protein